MLFWNLNYLVRRIFMFSHFLLLCFVVLLKYFYTATLTPIYFSHIHTDKYSFFCNNLNVFVGMQLFLFETLRYYSLFTNLIRTVSINAVRRYDTFRLAILYYQTFLPTHMQIYRFLFCFIISSWHLVSALHSCFVL